MTLISIHEPILPISVSLLGNTVRRVVHNLVKWFLLPLAVAACFAMDNVAPAELPVGYYSSEEAALADQ